MTEESRDSSLTERVLRYEDLVDALHQSLDSRAFWHVRALLRSGRNFLGRGSSPINNALVLDTSRLLEPTARGDLQRGDADVEMAFIDGGRATLLFSGRTRVWTTHQGSPDERAARQQLQAMLRHRGRAWLTRGWVGGAWLVGIAYYVIGSWVVDGLHVPDDPGTGPGQDDTALINTIYSVGYVLFLTILLFTLLSLWTRPLGTWPSWRTPGWLLRVGQIAGTVIGSLVVAALTQFL